ncbi:MAG TPA: group II intron reverse transcriptase/maturase [Erysipelothrix sp.]|nr:group II intron reverse transcriptase/maturase [Erysipelothrix sp.]
MELLETILDDINLDKAIQQVVRNKGSNGVDKMSTMELKGVMSTEFRNELKDKIRGRKYNPSPVLRVEIPKADGGVRELGIPTVIDRMIQQAILQVLSPIYEPLFSETSYGFRPERSAHMAITQALEYVNQSRDWIVDIDLEKFFDRVNHDKLIQIVSDTVKDGDVVSLIRKYLQSGVMIDEEYKESVIGTPQGGPLSPLLANIILDKLDKELERRGLRFVRYADDIQIYVKTEKAANRVMKNVTRFLEEELKLKVNMTKSKVRRPNDPGTKFLGFGFYKDSRAYLYKTKPHMKSVKSLKDKIRFITSRSKGWSIERRLNSLRYLFRGWFNYFKIGAIKTLTKTIDRFTRVRLRIVIWKQWKTIKGRYRGLKKLGVNPRKAWEWANTRKKYARVANSFILSTTVTNAILKIKGFLPMEDLYLEYSI